MVIETVDAQIPQDPLSFNHRAVLFGTRQLASDPVSTVMPGTAFGSGLGSYRDNPASIALLESGLALELGITYRSIAEETLHFGVANDKNIGSSGLSNMSLIFSRKGEGRGLVLAAGFTDHAVFDRATIVNSFNESSSITDLFKATGSPYREMARETGAIVAGDESGTWFDSTFRRGEGMGAGFQGIRQQAEIVQSGESGELSVALATELKPDLFVGISMGYLRGSHSYQRVFQEIDDTGLYRGVVSVGSTNQLSLHSLTLEDQMESSFSGLRTRVGLVYRVLTKLTVGGSYTFPTTVTVEENLNAALRTRTDPFDDQNDARDEFERTLSFEVVYPPIISIGAAISGLYGFSASFSFDHTDYRQVRLDLLDTDLFDLEVQENQVIRSNYSETLSIRGGVAWEMSEDIAFRAGYAIFPSVYLGGTDWKRVITLGGSIALSERIRFDLGARYMVVEDESSLYSRTDYSYSNLINGVPTAETRNEGASSRLSQVLLTSNVQIRF